MRKYLLRFLKVVLFLMGVAFVAFWAWTMWDEMTPPPETPELILPPITGPQR